MKRRMLACLLSLCLLAGLFPTASLAAAPDGPPTSDVVEPVPTPTPTPEDGPVPTHFPAPEGELILTPAPTPENSPALPPDGVPAGNGLPTPAPVEGTVYVHSKGNDDTGTGGQDAPYATLAKAVEKAKNGDTIYVMSDLTMTKCARFYNKSLTITSGAGDPYIVTRGDGFETIQDDARSTYNPAMIEVQADSGDGPYNLTLTNIVLDDGGKHEGTVFAQAISGSGNGQNDNYVQDAIVASNATVPCTITLGDGAILRNFGGMSAVRVTDSAKLVMLSGSVIEDTTVEDRERGATDSNGPAGAVWIQGAEFVMEDGAEIKNMVGRAVYVDGGEASIGGTISDITGDADMWWGKDGVIAHVRNGAICALKSTCLITNNSAETAATGALFNVVQKDSRVDMESDAQIKDWHGAGNVFSISGLSNTERAYLRIDGKISNVDTSNSHVVQASNAKIDIGENAEITRNKVSYGTIYIQGGNAVEIRGKINYNYSNDRGGAVSITNHGDSDVTMYDSAEMIGNYSKETGGALLVSDGTFTMNGGIITQNYATLEGGGVYVRQGGNFIMNGGSITGNYTEKDGGGIAFVSDSNAIGRVVLRSGTIDGNFMNANVTPDSNNGTCTATGGVSNDLSVASSGSANISTHMSINSDFVLGNAEVYLEKYNVSVQNPANDLKFGNASAKSISAITTAAQKRGWSNQELVSLWVAGETPVTEMKISKPTNMNADLPLYAGVVAVDENGEPINDAEVNFYAAKLTNNTVEITLPTEDMHGNGCAVAIVQPTVNYGSVVIESPKTLNEVPGTALYDVLYTATYTMSENLKSIIDFGKDYISNNNCSFTFVVQLDRRLTAKTEVQDYTFTSPIFVVDRISGEGSTLTVTCKLRDGWTEHIKELTTTPMILTGTGVLNSSDFEDGGLLTTTGNIQVKALSQFITIPANICQTMMVKQETITVRPVELYKYLTSNDALVEGEDHSNCFPEPRYDGIPEDAVIKVAGEVWNPETHHNEPYPFTINYYENETAVVPIEDDHKPGVYVSKIEVLPGLKATMNQITIDEKRLDCQPGKLHILRAAEAGEIENIEELTSEIASTPPTALVGDAVVVNTENAIAFKVNNLDGQSPSDGANIRLLHDELLSAPNGQEDYYVGLLRKNLESNFTDLTHGGSTRRYAMKYLDFIDVHDSNLIMTASLSEESTFDLYLPYLDGADMDTEFRVFNFKGLYRTYADDTDYGPGVENAIKNCEASEFTEIKNTPYGIKVTVRNSDLDHGRLGAMALTWQQNDHTPGGGVDQDDDYTLYYHSNFGSDKRFYQTQSSSAMKVRDYEDMKQLPARAGYVFVCWNTEKDGSGRDYAPGDIYRVSGSSAHLYAQWDKTGLTPDDTGVSRWLNTTDHFAYLRGYGSGAFGPNDNMTRAEVAQMFYNLLLDRQIPVTVSFTDVPADAWYADAVHALASLGMLKGVGGGQFAPQRTITRAEFTVIAMRFTQLDSSRRDLFSDVSSDDWFYDQVAGAAAYGWITGYNDGTFRPLDLISRAEVTIITNRMLGRSADQDYVDRHRDSLRRFPDVAETDWAYYQIMEATNSHTFTAAGEAERWTGLAE